MKLDEPAFPLSVQASGYKPELDLSGLTKRELFAAMAMQGFLAGACTAESMDGIQNGARERNCSIDEFQAQIAVAQADALLAELSKERGSNGTP